MINCWQIDQNLYAKHTLTEISLEFTDVLVGSETDLFPPQIAASTTLNIQTPPADIHDIRALSSQSDILTCADSISRNLMLR